MASRGVYRTRTLDGAVEFAHVDHGGTTATEDMTRWFYETQRYEPPFDQLPTKQEYERQSGRTLTGPGGRKRRAGPTGNTVEIARTGAARKPAKPPTTARTKPAKPVDETAGPARAGTTTRRRAAIVRKAAQTSRG
jgi:hypothetical protein